MVSLINSHGTIPEFPQLISGRVAWQPQHARAPLHRHRLASGLPRGSWRDAAKRGIDVGIALLTLALHMPLLLIAAIAIRLDSPGPILFRQRRIGLHGHPFELLKFRTMDNRPSERGQLRQTCPGDPRVTRIGAVLRQTSFDELPQLWNVVRGEMSLVGPRPHAPGTCAGSTPFEQVSERYAQRHLVRPGMTGLAQVRGWRGQTDTEEKLLRRLDSDLEYISRWSLWLDCIILARTAATVLHMRNAY
jgi:lipopolysaccharide/colanic/teichoic acid biosynthesis glycosyltransferase